MKLDKKQSAHLSLLTKIKNTVDKNGEIAYNKYRTFVRVAVPDFILSIIWFAEI